MIQPLEPREDAAGEAAGEVDAAGEEPERREEELVRIQPGELRAAVEAVLFSVGEPVTIRTLADLFGAPVHDVREAVEELRLVYVETGRAFRLEDLAGGVQILTLSAYDPWVRKLREKERAGRLSAASLETLAVIAYKQPISKADLEAVRGVNCGPTLKTLLDRGLIQVVGRADALGKPLLYGTTKRFLESFGLASIRELPQPEIEQRIEERLQAERAGAAPAEARVGLEGEGLAEDLDREEEEGDAGDEAAAGAGEGAEPAETRGAEPENP